MTAEILSAEADQAASAAGACRAENEWVVLSGAPAFERVLRQRPCAKSAHFALHCLRNHELSTGKLQAGSQPVDDLVPRRKRKALPHLGLVVPKRHARRAVTRNLVKRQTRACWQSWWCDAARSLPHFDAIDWVVRLRAPIERQLYVSARSAGLAEVLRLELQGLFPAGLKSLARASARPAA